MNRIWRPTSLGLLITAVTLISQAHSASAQELNLVPRFVRQGYDPQYPTAHTFLDACLNLDQWSYVRSVTSYLGYWDNLNDTDSGLLSSCFQNMNANGLRLSIEAGAWDAGCATGDQCFSREQPRLQALVSLGAPPILLRMQEPFSNCKSTAGCTPSYVADQIASYMKLMRGAFSGIRIVDIEGYPFNTYLDLAGDINALAQSTSAIGTGMPEYFEIDHDWQRQDWNFIEVNDLKIVSNAWGMAFGVIFWNSTAPETDTNNAD